MKKVIVGSMKTAKPVRTQPEVVLRNYRIFEADDGRHFVGYVPEVDKMRVSTAITDWSADEMIGTTSSGRRYRLEGPSSNDGLALDAWRIWTKAYGMAEGHEVTAEYSATAGPGPH